MTKYTPSIPKGMTRVEDYVGLCKGTGCGDRKG